MSDYHLLFVFVLVSIACFIIYFKSINEQKKWINLYAKKFKKETYEDAIDRLQRNPFLAPFYSIKFSLFWFYMLFKKTNDLELSHQAHRVKNYFYLILILVFFLIIVLVAYTLFYLYKN